MAKAIERPYPELVEADSWWIFNNETGTTERKALISIFDNDFDIHAVDVTETGTSRSYSVTGST